MLFCKIADICLVQVIATGRVSEAPLSDVPATIHRNIQSKKILRTSTIDLRVSSVYICIESDETSRGFHTC